MAMVGARWDDSSQYRRFEQASRHQLIDYVEVNYPYSGRLSPGEVGRPIFVHTNKNGLASNFGINWKLAKFVSEQIKLTGSPWAGEHLTWFAPGQEGGTGYNINPLFTSRLIDSTVSNVAALQKLYGCPIALELGTLYTLNGDLEHEAIFLSEVARRTSSLLIFDAAHWFASNKNTGRPVDAGLKHLDFSRVVEIHVAGVFPGSGGLVWHDAHHVIPSSDVLALAADVKKDCKELKAITLEHDESASETDFLRSLELVRCLN